MLCMLCPPAADVTAAPDTFVDETSNNSDFMVQSNKPKLGHMRIIDSDSDDDDSHTEMFVVFIH